MHIAILVCNGCSVKIIGINKFHLIRDGDGITHDHRIIFVLLRLIKNKFYLEKYPKSNN